MTAFFELLLGYRLAELSEGTFFFGLSINFAFMMAGVVLIPIVVWFLYRKTTAPLSDPIKLGLILLKSMALILLFISLLRPLISTSLITPQESYLAILIDDSQSMSIEDMDDNLSRGEAVRELLYSEQGLLEEFKEKFQIRTFRFASETHRLLSSKELQLKGPRTSLAQSLEYAVEELKGFPLSGLVVFSDGRDNSSQDPLRTATLLKSLNVPIFTVGVGKEEIEKDIEIAHVRTSKTVLEGSIFDVQVMIRNQGYEGHEVELLIEESGQVVTSKKVTLGKSGGIGQHTLQLIPEQEGLLVYTLQIKTETEEIITKNNVHSFLIDNQKKQVDILYIEGHPRNEYKFIQRAIKGDESLRLVTYLQTGPHKFLRQGLKSPQELAKGYPQTREELYEYEAIIFGDVSKAFFTAEQLVMTQDFVSKRGGGFLMIGGSTAFEEGYIDTPISDILPVMQIHDSKLPPALQGGSRKGEHLTGEKFDLLLTSEGEQSPILRLGFEKQANQEFWQKMPSLQGINVTGRAKPGASVLAVHPTLRYQNIALPVIVYERYGRGRTMAIMTASTWRWQMLLPHEDLSHERVWRQIVRWLTINSSAQVEISLNRNSYHIGDEVEIRATVFDQSYEPVNDATVWLKITDPRGAIQDIQLKWAIEEKGIYQGTFMVNEEGIFNLEVSTTSPSKETQEATTGLLVTSSSTEYTNAGLDSALLQKISEVSGGKYYQIDETDQLLNDVEQAPSIHKIEVEQDLWNIPLVLLMLLTFFSLEWLIRRRKGLS